MKALVTGGCGFIGSHISEILLERGDEVVIIDNLSTGRIENIKDFGDNEKLSFHQCDISDFDTIKDHFEGIDTVFHIAALADIVPSIERPKDYHQSNVIGTFNVLEACRQAGVERLVYAASSSCYGIPDGYPTKEDAEIRPQYPYALTKYVGEEYVMHWSQVYGLKATSLRFFNVYGPRSRTSGTYGAVFGVFLAQKLNEKPFTVVGDGEQTRDFTFVTDVAKACIMASESEMAVGEIMNVGSGNTYSINKLVGLLGGDIEYIPKRPGEPDCTFADTAKIQRILNWSPEVSFEDGVQKMLDNIDYWREAPVWDKSSIEVATRDWFKYLS